MSDRLFAIWIATGVIGLYAVFVALCIEGARDYWPWGALFLLVPLWAGVFLLWLLYDMIQTAIHNDILWRKRR